MKVKVADNNGINICVGTTDGTNSGYINVKTSKGTIATPNSWYDATRAATISNTMFVTDAVSEEPDYDMGWDTIYVKINSETGVYNLYVNDTQSHSTGNLSNSVVNTKLNYVRFDCYAGAKGYIDYIKVYDASKLRVPASSDKTISYNFNGYTEGKSAIGGLFYNSNDTATTAVIAKDPLNEENKCVKIDIAAGKILDIPLSVSKAVVEFKTYNPDAGYIQTGAFYNAESKHMTTAYATAGGQVNIGSTYELDGRTWAKTNDDAWNTFKYVIDTTAEDYTVYTYVNGQYVNKVKYDGEIKIMRLGASAAPDILYLDDFSVSYSMPWEVVKTGLYQNGEEITEETVLDSELPVQFGYTIFNIGGAAKASDLVLAVYNSDGDLKAVQKVSDTIREGVAEKMVDIGATGEIAEGDTAKVLWWNGMKPYTAPFDL